MPRVATRLGLDPKIVEAARNDINPESLRADKLLDDIRIRHPAVKLDLLPAIGEVAELRDAIAHWLIKAAPEIPA